MFDNQYCHSVCDELQRFKYKNENRLKPSWTSEEWNGGGYSAKIMFWARSWKAAEASVHLASDNWLHTLHFCLLCTHDTRIPGVGQGLQITYVPTYQSSTAMMYIWGLYQTTECMYFQAHDLPRDLYLVLLFDNIPFNSLIMYYSLQYNSLQVLVRVRLVLILHTLLQ